MKTCRVSLTLLLALALAGCGQGGDLLPLEPQSSPTQEKPVEVPPLPTPQPDSTTQGDLPQMPSITQTPSSELEALITKAKEDLAERLSIAISQIDVMDARSVTWPNSSLGCPQAGMLYTEVLTPGYLILLNANGQDYEYHAGRNSVIFLCDNPIPPVPGTPEDV